MWVTLFPSCFLQRDSFQGYSKMRRHCGRGWLPQLLQVTWCRQKCSHLCLRGKIALEALTKSPSYSHPWQGFWVASWCEQVCSFCCFCVDFALCMLPLRRLHHYRTMHAFSVCTRMNMDKCMQSINQPSCRTLPSIQKVSFCLLAVVLSPPTKHTHYPCLGQSLILLPVLWTNSTYSRTSYKQTFERYILCMLTTHVTQHDGCMYNSSCFFIAE